MSFVKWDECPHCGGKGCELTAFEAAILETNNREVQCPVCRLHSQLAERDELIAAHEECHEDKKRLVREIDEIMNGKDGMAKQASLCDLVGDVRKLKAENARLKAALEKYGDHTAQCGLQAAPEVCYRCTCGLNKALAEGVE